MFRIFEEPHNHADFGTPVVSQHPVTAPRFKALRRCSSTRRSVARFARDVVVACRSVVVRNAAWRKALRGSCYTHFYLAAPFCTATPRHELASTVLLTIPRQSFSRRSTWPRTAPTRIARRAFRDGCSPGIYGPATCKARIALRVSGDRFLKAGEKRSRRCRRAGEWHRESRGCRTPPGAR